ncbi:rhomboid family intramembrane serine protease [Nanoarchaeota archaeon]
MPEKEIESESMFLLKLIWSIIKLPFTLIMVLFKKKEISDLAEPIKEIFKFIFEAKFTLTIIIINFLIFGATTALPGLINIFAQFPADLFSSRVWSLFTAGFIHANLAHIIGNMLFMFVCGRVVERELGSAKTALIYFGALLISGVFSALIHLFVMKDNIPGVGASGALMGIVATAMLVAPFYITYEILIPLPLMLVGWIAIWSDITGIINPTEDGIGHFAHLGGFLSITLLMFLIGSEDRGKIWKGFLINLISIAVLAGIYFALKATGYSFPKLG